MHPIHLEALAADRRRGLHAEAARLRLTSEARSAANPRRRNGLFAALVSVGRRSRANGARRRALPSALLIEDRPYPGIVVPLWMLRESAPSGEPRHGV
jgi:hypothetical protein